MHGTLSQESWGVHGNPMLSSNCSHIFENANECSGQNVQSQRNYACDSHIRAYFGDVNLGGTGRPQFQLQLYQCMISQMLWMKGEIETIRSTNVFGTLIWQLNENWPTGGWGLLEYGSQYREDGQIMGGRWKPLMYLLRRSLFRNVFATCGQSGRCYIRNDGTDLFVGTVHVESWDFSGVVRTVFRNHISLGPNGDISK